MGPSSLNMYNIIFLIPFNAPNSHSDLLCRSKLKRALHHTSSEHLIFYEQINKYELDMVTNIIDCGAKGFYAFLLKTAEATA